MVMDVSEQKKSQIPFVGLGTWRLNGQECVDVVKAAIELGYRGIDTADLYENHRDIGKALSESELPRSSLYITTKLWDITPSKVASNVERFLDELDTPYVDMLLIHWPNAEVSMHETLQEMNKQKEKGLVRHIGVSNFVRFHFDELASYHLPIDTNQVEMHVYLQRPDLYSYCLEHGIPLTAYRPLAKGAFKDDDTLQAIGRKHGKSASQVALRFLVQRGVAVIPKAGSVEHLKANIELFDFALSDDELLQIKELDSRQRFCTPAGMPIYDD